MTVLLLIGEDEYAISQQLAALKRQLDPNWLTFNYHAFSPTQLDEALNAARTPAVVSLPPPAVARAPGSGATPGVMNRD